MIRLTINEVANGFVVHRDEDFARGTGCSVEKSFVFTNVYELAQFINERAQPETRSAFSID